MTPGHPFEGEDEQRVERDVDKRAQQHRAHCKPRIALRQNKRVESLRQHDENRAAGIDFKIGNGELHRTFRASKQQYDLPRKAERRCADHNAKQDQQAERSVKDPVRLIRLSLAELDARPRRAAKPDQIRKCLHDQRDGKYDPKRGQRVHAGAFDPRDVHSVDDII